MDQSQHVVTWLGLDFNLGIVISTTAAALIVFLIARAGAASIPKTGSSIQTPSGMQNFMEFVIEFVRNVISSTMDLKKGERYIGLGVTLIMYIFVSNILGLPFSIIAGPTEAVYWTTPTADPHVTLSLAAGMILLTQFYGIREYGVGGFFKSYLHPQPWMLPLTIIEQFASALTLGMRLFGNMFAGGLLLGLLAGAINSGIFVALGAVIPMLLWEAFSIFVAAIQSFIFLILTMVYISNRAAID